MNEPLNQILLIVQGAGGALVMVIAGSGAMVLETIGPAIVALYGMKRRSHWTLNAFHPS